MNDVSENDAILIRKLAKSWLSLHAEMFREQPDILDALLANENGWVTGYDEKQDYYWVRIDSADGKWQIMPWQFPPRWGYAELQALRELYEAKGW